MQGLPLDPVFVLFAHNLCTLSLCLSHSAFAPFTPCLSALCVQPFCPTCPAFPPVMPSLCTVSALPLHPSCSAFVPFMPSICTLCALHTLPLHHSCPAFAPSLCALCILHAMPLHPVKLSLCLCHHWIQGAKGTMDMKSAKGTKGVKVFLTRFLCPHHH